MVEDKQEHYSSLLVWAIVRKMRCGMRSWEVEIVYGIPQRLATEWSRFAFTKGK